MISILLRCVIIYALLVLSMRLTGKRQIGQIELSELITTLLLSELAAIPITDPEIPMLYALVPIFALCALEVLVTYTTSINPRIRAFIAGKPSAVIRKGKIDQKELKKIRMSASELMSQLRIKGISDPSQVRYAFFEEDGQLSVIEDDGGEYIYLLVLDGHISSFDLKESGFGKKKILKYLTKKNINIKDVFIMTIDENNKITIILKEGK